MNVHLMALKALADPRRFAIMEALRSGERCVNDIVAEIGIDQSGVSRHLHVLAEAGLVSSRRDGQRKMYAVRAEPLQELEHWAQEFTTAWDAQMDRLEAHLASKEDDVS